jgi:hypothetical protein
LIFPTDRKGLKTYPQRLATKRLKPSFFRVQQGIEIGRRSYDGVGNVALLMEERYATVHVRRDVCSSSVRGCMMAENATSAGLTVLPSTQWLKRYVRIYVTPTDRKETENIWRIKNFCLILQTESQIRPEY